MSKILSLVELRETIAVQKQQWEEEDRPEVERMKAEIVRAQKWAIQECQDYFSFHTDRPNARVFKVIRNLPELAAFDIEIFRDTCGQGIDTWHVKPRTY